MKKDVPKEVSKKKEFPPYKPVAYFGGNLLLFGLSYALLRQYTRFFILFGALVVSTVLSTLANLSKSIVGADMPTNLGGITSVYPSFISAIPWNTIQTVIIIASAIDAYIIAKKLKDKEIPEPKPNNILAWIIIALWLVNIAFFIITELSFMGW